MELPSPSGEVAPAGWDRIGQAARNMSGKFGDAVGEAAEGDAKRRAGF